MKNYNLNNIQKITIIDGKIEVEYQDGVKFTINNVSNVIFKRDLKNPNDQPIVDHCI